MSTKMNFRQFCNAFYMTRDDSKSSLVAEELIKFSLVTLTSRFEATRGLFWDGTRYLNLGQMTRSTPEQAPPLHTSAPHQLEDVWPSTYDLACNGPNAR
ncbi:hypothetical protein AVEN_265462-1 [Araneus ventricosus]|uniref:Uncharacterized protein n=1 Tax=Araneus ventricosus TaxID=182803 RepID=A0A4Y2CG72_ARAVE|nr:hypothetical protein AVEN_265462-1 [Araneus ventricosus]